MKVVVYGLGIIGASVAASLRRAGHIVSGRNRSREPLEYALTHDMIDEVTETYDGADIVFYPTAIGCISGESVEDAENFSGAWETVQRGHAVANGCYVAAANRVGTEEAPNGGFVKFWGGSFCANPYGRVVAKASADSEEILFAEVDFGLVAEFRRTWPFFRDRRIDTYSDILKRLKK